MRPRLVAHSSSPARVAVLVRKATRPVMPAAVGPARIPGISMPSCETPCPRSHLEYGLWRVAVVVSCSWATSRSYASIDTAATWPRPIVSSTHDHTVRSH
eukprot:10733512-Alexandrium_andersonii.AAC.1